MRWLRFHSFPFFFNNPFHTIVFVPLLSDSDLQLAAKPGSPDSLQQLIEIVKNPVANAASLSGFTIGKEDKARQSRDKKVRGLCSIIYRFV